MRCWRDLPGLREPDRFEAGCTGRRSTRVATSRGAPGGADRSPRYRPETQADGDDYGQLADHDESERAFLQLPADQRIALVLTDYVGYSAPELAVILNVPTGTVNWRLDYGARAMREALAGSQPSPTAASEPMR